MKNKEKFLYSLYQARLEHTKWISKVRILSTGSIDDEIKKQKSFFDTPFSQWFKEKAVYLLFDNDCSSFKEIELLMQHLDSEYLLLYHITIKNREKSMFGNIKPLTKEQVASAEKYFNSILIISEKIGSVMNEASTNISSVDEERFSFMNEESGPKEKEKEKSIKSHSGARGAYQG